MSPLKFNYYETVVEDQDFISTSENINDMTVVQGSWILFYKVYVINDDGRLLINPKRFLSENGNVYKPDGNDNFKSRACSADEIEQISLLKINGFLTKMQDQEVIQIINQRDRFKKLVFEFPVRDDLKNILTSIDELILKYEDWYINNGIEFRFLKESKKNASRLNLMELEKEVLYPRIADLVNEKYDEGLLTLSNIYKLLSEQSKALFQYSMTETQIRGIYERFVKKHKEYKRLPKSKI